MPAIIINNSCITDWQDQLEKATNQLSIKCSEYEMQSAALDDLCDWVSQISNCITQIEETDSCRSFAVDKLVLFFKNVESVCSAIECLSEAVDILYCDIISIANCIEELYNKVVDLKNEIECIKETPITKENSHVLSCLCELEAQLKPILELYNSMLSEIVAALKCIKKIECLVCDKNYGLIKIIAEMLECLGSDVGEELCGKETPPAPTHDSDCDDDSLKPLCTEKIECPTFPLTDLDFYKDLKTKKTTAQVLKEDCQKRVDEIYLEKIKLEACKQSLDQAITDSTKAASAK